MKSLYLAEVIPERKDALASYYSDRLAYCAARLDKKQYLCQQRTGYIGGCSQGGYKFRNKNDWRAELDEKIK